MYNEVARSLKSRSVQWVDLSQCNELVIKPQLINTMDIELLSSALGNASTTLSTLSIGSSNVGPRGIKRLASALENNFHLTDLKLYINLGPSVDEVVAALEQNTRIQTLQLTNSNLDKDGVARMINALNAPGAGYNDVRLTAQGLGAPAAMLLASVITGNQKIKSLALNNNYLDDNATTIIAQALPNSGIQSLVLDDNDIGDNGAKALAAALADPKCKLTSLSVARNMINAIGAGQLMDALASSKITEINLAGNQISQSAGKSLVASLTAATQVTRVNLRNNYIKPKTLKQIYTLTSGRTDDV